MKLIIIVISTILICRVCQFEKEKTSDAEIAKVEKYGKLFIKAIGIEVRSDIKRDNQFGIQTKTDLASKMKETKENKKNQFHSIINEILTEHGALIFQLSDDTCIRMDLRLIRKRTPYIDFEFRNENCFQFSKEILEIEEDSLKFEKILKEVKKKYISPLMEYSYKFSVELKDFNEYEHTNYADLKEKKINCIAFILKISLFIDDARTKAKDPWNVKEKPVQKTSLFELIKKTVSSTLFPPEKKQSKKAALKKRQFH